MRHLFSLLILIGACSATTYACSCDEVGVPPCEEYRRANAVFVGRVKAILDDGVPIQNRGDVPVRFDVEQVFKGSLGPTSDVRYGFNSSCSWLDFKVGDRWLVYAYSDKDGELRIPYCTGTHPFKESSYEASFLQDLRQGKTEEYVSGVVLGEEDAEVSVGTTKGTLRTSLDGEGSFRLKVPSAGKYRVEIKTPFAAEISSYDPEYAVKILEQSESRSIFEYSADVQAGLCSWRQIRVRRVDLKATGEISGRLLDAERKPVSGLTVYLARWNIGEGEALEKLESAYPDSSGAFSFPALRAGKYVVLVNPGDFPSSRVPYLKTYLPGVPRFSDSFVVDVNEGETTRLVDFVLPRKVKLVPVEVRVVWPGGRPARFRNPGQTNLPPAFSVYKTDGGYVDDLELRRTSQPGIFTVELYEGFSYIVTAASVEVDDKFGAGFARVTVRKNVAPITITLLLSNREAAEWLDKIRAPNTQ